MLKNFLRLTPYAIITALLATLLYTTFTFAQEPTPSDDEVNKIAKQLYCPVCESTPLDACPTEACRQWRELIRTMLAEGKSEEEIIQYFVDTYGARASAEPPNRLAAYLIPTVAILLGVLLLVRGFQMWLKPPITKVAAGEREAKPTPEDPYIARLEEELQKRK
ncbi:MAG TPA: cytochrome c-type biogenesis protein CcmH [Anaerolineales bacterium]|nr:cytochrome c-type biogenesis protein CcmH [Anaerolineales bacterium]